MNHRGSGQNGNASHENRHHNPPEVPALTNKVNTTTESSDIKRELKLTVEFPLRDDNKYPNDLALYFKRLATVLFIADPTLAILNWHDPVRNPISRAKDIDCNEKAVKEYYTGVRIIPARRKITGFVKVNTSNQFWKTKQHPRLWAWLSEHKVYI